MNHLANNDQGALIKYLLHNETAVPLPTPFERDIYLFDTYVAGTTHIEGIEALATSLRDGDRLVFYREPDNPHDPQAIRIETLEKKKIGYVPRRDNVVFSRLMDAGSSFRNGCGKGDAGQLAKDRHQNLPSRKLR